VREARFRTGRFADELVPACARVVAAWGPDPAPRAVVAVPSLRAPELVPGFAERLAEALSLPFLDVIRRVGHGPPQREMENSSQQAANVAGEFEISAAPPAGEPLLLVDDLWFSGWTMTTIGALLRDAGAGPVHPLVLSLASV
jgi:ATP-dependent DNA helicase RecQ